MNSVLRKFSEPIRITLKRFSTANGGLLRAPLSQVDRTQAHSPRWSAILPLLATMEGSVHVNRPLAGVYWQADRQSSKSRRM
jgi:hypothetical protein